MSGQDWTSLVALVRQVPGMVADRMDGWVMDTHRPSRRDPGRCWACSKPWPCRHHIDAADRHGARANRRTDA